MQSKRKAFNIAEARIADTGAAQFFDARKGVAKAEAAAMPTKRTARSGLHALPLGCCCVAYVRDSGQNKGHLVQCALEKQ